MSAPSSLRSPRLSRRSVIAAAAVGVGGVLVGCTAEDGGARGDAAKPVSSPEPPDPDLALAAEARRDEQAVLDLLEATQQRHPDLSDALAPAVEVHTAHVSLLADAADAGESAAPDVSGSSTPARGATPSPGGSPSPSPPEEPRVPRSARRALEQVVAQEQELATLGRQHAFGAQSGAFARVLASMAAAAAQQAVVLAGTSIGKDAS